jgi:hypothetical protein
MKESAFNDGVEGFAELVELARVLANKPHCQSSLQRLVLRHLECEAGKIDAGCLKAEARGHERMLAGATTNIQHPAVQSARFGEGAEGGLRVADVPRRRAGVEVIRSARLD